MSTPNPTHIDVIAKHSLEFSEFYVEWRCRCEHPDARWSGAGISVRPLHAAHVVSKLTDAGYSIVPTPPLTAEQRDADGNHIFDEGGDLAICIECGVTRSEHQRARAAAGIENAAVDPDETAGQYMHRTGEVPPWFSAAAEGEKP